MPITATNWTAVDNWQDVFAIANVNGGGYFWTGINFLIFFVIMITLTGTFGWEAGLLSASFIGLVLSLLLLYLSLVSLKIVAIFVGLIIIGIIYIIWSNRYD